MDSLKKSPFLKGWVIARILLGGMFMFSGFEKLSSPPQNFQYVLEEYRILPRFLEKSLARVLPWVEFMAGVFVAAGLWLQASLTGALVLFGSFIVVVAQALFRRLPITECGCFGEQFSFPLQVVLVMDSFLFLLTGALLLNLPKAGHWSLDRY